MTIALRVGEQVGGPHSRAGLCAVVSTWRFLRARVSVVRHLASIPGRRADGLNYHLLSFINLATSRTTTMSLFSGLRLESESPTADLHSRVGADRLDHQALTLQQANM